MIPRQRLGLLTSMLAAVCAATWFGVHRPSYADQPRVTVQFHLLDVPSGKLVPAVVCIRNLDYKDIELVTLPATK